ncbi:hypothetical protein D9M68_779540 [compost metagenome]
MRSSAWLWKLGSFTAAQRSPSPAWRICAGARIGRIRLACANGTSPAEVASWRLPMSTAVMAVSGMYSIWLAYRLFMPFRMGLAIGRGIGLGLASIRMILPLVPRCFICSAIRKARS